MKARTVLLLAPLALAAAPPSKPAPAADPTLAEGRRLTKALYEGEFTQIWKQLSPAARSLLGEPVRLEQLRAGWQKEFGRETKVLEEKTDSLAGVRRYLRIATFDKAKAPVEVPWTFNRNGEIATLGVRPRVVEAIAPHADAAPQVALRLPFEGEWTVWWGGRTVWTNFHAALSDQRFAADFFVVKGGRTYSGDGTRNEDYFAFGRGVLAPAAGTVVAVQDGRPDGVPGRVEREADPAGNYIALDLGDKVFAFFLHLKNGSLAVAPGQKVKAGQLLARAGSSGRGLEPSLHIHLQDSPERGQGAGWPLVFRDVLVDGAPKSAAEPVRGERFAPRTAAGR